MRQEELEKKAKQFDALLLEHDKLARELSLLQSKFDLSKEDEKKVNELKKQMASIQYQAQKLGSY